MLRKTLAVGLFLIMGMIVLMAIFIYIAQIHEIPQSDTEFAEFVCYDYDLLTEQEKEWARESGVGSYRLGNMYYVDEGLPEEYWIRKEETDETSK